MLALLRFVAEQQPSFGDSLEDALKAERVLLVGAGSEAGQQAAAVLTAAAVAVEPFPVVGAGKSERSLVPVASSNGAHGEQSVLTSW